MNRARARDREAFDMLVEQHAAEVYRLTAAIVGTGDAADVAQEALVVAWQQLPKLRDGGAFTPWLRRICVCPHSLIALRMADGALLRMPTAAPLDRAGTRYSGNVIPDDIVADGDAAVDAAVQWLETQPGCS